MISKCFNYSVLLRINTPVFIRKMSVDISEMRLRYKDKNDTFLEKHLVSKEPFEQFKAWFEEACSRKDLIEPNAMCLATVSNPLAKPCFDALTMSSPILIQMNPQGKWENAKPESVDEEQLCAVVKQLVKSEAVTAAQSYCNQCAVDSLRESGNSNYVPVIMMPIYPADQCPFDIEHEIQKMKESTKTKPTKKTPFSSIYVTSIYFSFEQTWTIANSGSEQWPGSCRLIQAGGEPLGATPYYVPPLPPGNSTSVTLKLVAPTTPEAHTAYFQLFTDKGEQFGDNKTVTPKRDTG